MAVKYLVGIDFGHGETTASCYDIYGTQGSKESVRLNIGKGDDKQRKKPSVVYRKLKRDGSCDYRLDKSDGYALYISFKDNPSILNDTQNKKRSNREKKEAFQNFIRLIYDRIIENNKFLTKEGTEFLLYIASPTRWDEAEKANYKRFVEEAIKRPVEWVINESDAAYFKKNEEGKEGLALVIDFGSSTIDYTLMHNKRKIDIDYLSNRLGAEQIECDLLNVYKDNPRSNYTTFKTISENLKKEGGHSLVDIDIILKHMIRIAKENAYSREESDLYFLANIDWTYLQTKTGNIYKGEFGDFEEKYLGGYIASVHENFQNLKEEIYKRYPVLNTKPQQLHIILSGGASRMPWVKEKLEEVFVDTDIEDDSYPEYIVSDGIVKYAYALWCVKTELLKIADKFHNWFSTIEADLKDMIQKECLETCLETTKNDPRIIDYCSANFEDGTIDDDTPENPVHNYYKSSIKGFMNIVDDVNQDILSKRKSINDNIYQNLNQKLHDSLYKELHKALLDTLQKDISEMVFLQNQHFLPTINNDFTIGSDNFKEISSCCVNYLDEKHNRIFQNTEYGDGGFMKGSYRKERNQGNRKLIAESYYKYIEGKSFAPYSDEELKQIKDGIYSQVIDAIINITEEHLAFEPCGYDLKKELFSKCNEDKTSNELTSLNTDVGKVFSMKVTYVSSMGADSVVEGEIKLGEVAKGDTLFIGDDNAQIVHVKDILDNEVRVGGIVRMILDCGCTIIKVGTIIHSKTSKN